MSKKNKKNQKDKKADEKPQLHEDLTGFDIHINEFGEIVSNRPIEKLNDFLDENVEDKKLSGREDLKERKLEEEEE